MRSAVEHLLELIRIPSVSSMSNRGVVEYASEVFRKARWNAVTMRHVDADGVEKLNLIAAPPEQDANQSATGLAFLCHTDTVPYSADWAGALNPFVADGVLYGCGACDVKGFLACLLTAVEETSAIPHGPGLRVVLTADEEIGCLGAHRLLASGLIRPRRLVIGEPTSLHPSRAGKGYCLAEVTIFGVEAHSAHPQRGRSAIYGAARMIREIEILARQLAEIRNEFFSPAFTTMNIGTIQGGTAKNIVPAQCRFLVEWRPIPGDAAEPVPQAIARIGQRMVESDPGFRFELNILRQQTGFETPPAAGLVRLMENLSGRPSISIPFGSEASVFATVAEEIVVFGPGDMRTAHSPRECVSASQLQEAVVCIGRLMQSAAG